MCFSVFLCSFQAEEAEATYRTCIADATTQQQELEDVKVNVLKQIQDVIRQSDQILRAVSLHPAHALMLPLGFLPQALTLALKLYSVVQ